VVEGMPDRYICMRPTHSARGRRMVRADLLPHMGSTRERLGFEALPCAPELRA
jgi:hypothetical protein